MLSCSSLRADIKTFLLLYALSTLSTGVVLRSSAQLNPAAEVFLNNLVSAPKYAYYTDNNAEYENNDQGSSAAFEEAPTFRGPNILSSDKPAFFIPQGAETKTAREEIYLLEDKDYPKSLFESYQGVGQVSGIATLPSGDVAIFHRSNRDWTSDTFSSNETVAEGRERAQEHLIKNDTIMIIDRDNGGEITTLGSNLFYMPHGIASDQSGNLWVTDVARHQVMRLPTSLLQLPEIIDSELAHGHLEKDNRRWLPGNMTRVWPDIILGEAFVPGNDLEHFCKPSEIEVSPDGRLVFIADGYCNQRIMVFTGAGKFVTSFGELYDMSIVHSLTLIVERNLICAADRENSKILCFRAGLDGDLSSIGKLELEIDYPLGKVFAIEAISPYNMLVSSNQAGSSRFDLATLNPFSKELKLTWTSSDLLAPHALAKTQDNNYVYAADISKGSYKKLFKFIIIKRKLAE